MARRRPYLFLKITLGFVVVAAVLFLSRSLWLPFAGRALIHDDGPGIPLEDRDRVFERFTRLDPSRAHAEEGSAGLGLALVRAVVERHHGTVEVTDSPAGGARLQVHLPAARP